MMSVSASPPAAPDGGWGWIALSASVINVLLIAGFNEGMGVLYVEWQEYFSVGPSEVGWTGVIGALMGPVGCLFAGGLTSRFGHRPVVTLGGFLYCVLMFISSFTSRLWHLYVVLGIQAMVTGLPYQPSITVTGFYFQRWLAVANGITYSGAGIGLILVPIVLETLASWKDWKGALRIFSAISLSIPFCGLLFKPSAKEKYILKRTRSPENHHRKGFLINFLGIDLLLKNHRFLLVTAACSVMGYGYYGSVVFLASKAVYEVGLTKFQGALLVSFIGIGSTISRASHGLLLDCGLVTPVALFSLGCFVNAATNFLHPFAQSFCSLVVLAISFGLSSGVVFAVSIMCVRKVLHEDQVTRGFGVIILGNGIGRLIGVFAMAYLQEIMYSFNVSFVVAGIAMVLSGTLMALVGLCMSCCTIGPHPSNIREGHHRICEASVNSTNNIDDINMDERMNEKVGHQSMTV